MIFVQRRRRCSNFVPGRHSSGWSSEKPRLEGESWGRVEEPRLNNICTFVKPHCSMSSSGESRHKYHNIAFRTLFQKIV